MSTVNRRLQELSRWMSEGQRPINPEFAAIAAKSDKLKKVKPSNLDPRERMFSIPIGDKMGQKLAFIARKTNYAAERMKVEYSGMSWSRRVCEGSLNAVYEGLRQIIGHDHPLLKDTKDLKIKSLFDVLEGFDLGIELKVPRIGTPFSIKTPLALANFMTSLLNERPKSGVAKAIFASTSSLDKLCKNPEEMRLSTLLRVLDHFEVRPAIADIRERQLRDIEASGLEEGRSEILSQWGKAASDARARSQTGLRPS